MKVKDHSWNSSSLRQEMALREYGSKGKPLVVFPPQGGTFQDFEGFGMVDICRPYIDDGRIRLFSVSSVDNQSWAHPSAHPAERALRHEEYDRYIVNELIPFIRQECGRQVKCLTTGCSMGGYHAANFYFRHPDIFDGVISLSGVLDLKIFIGDYMDTNVYFNSPLHFLRRLDDPYYLDLYNEGNAIICVGQGAWEDHMLADARRLAEIAEDRNLPVWVDIWGHDVNHDWPWWKRQLPYFLDHLTSRGVLTTSRN